MKLFVMYASIFVLAFGLAASLASIAGAGPSQRYCVTEIYEPFVWCSEQMGPLCQDPIEYDFYQYLCQGRWSDTKEPCQCTYIGCCYLPD
jgi:hypothetical protein